MERGEGREDCEWRRSCGERPKKLCHANRWWKKRTKINFKLLKNYNKTIGSAWEGAGSQLDLGYTSWLLIHVPL